MGHSLGGVLARYAAGVLYDPATGTMCGLKPRHYISLASPHMGSDVAGPYAVSTGERSSGLRAAALWNFVLAGRVWQMVVQCYFLICSGLFSSTLMFNIVLSLVWSTSGVQGHRCVASC